jgi:hypothetical protein
MRFSEEQIIGFLREAEAGVAVKDLCRKHGFSEVSYYRATFAQALRRHGPHQSVPVRSPLFSQRVPNHRTWLRRRMRNLLRTAVIEPSHNQSFGGLSFLWIAPRVTTNRTDDKNPRSDLGLDR